MRERAELHGEKHAGFKDAEPERAIIEEASADPAGIGKGWQQQCIKPDEEPDGDAPHGAARRGPPPHHGTEEGRRELRHRRKRQEPHLRQRRRRPDHPVIGIGEAEDAENRRAADEDQRLAHVLVHGGAFAAPPQQQRHDEVVAHHDRQCHALDDDHGRRGRQPAEKRHEGDHLAARGHRQGQHEGIAIGPRRQQQQARHGDRNDEDVDGHQIGREHPGGALELVAAGVLDRRHVELARQQHDGKRRQQRHGQPLPAIEATGKQRRDSGFGRGTFEKRPDAAHHTEHDETADRHEGHQLHQRFDRDGENHAVLMLGGVDVAGTEQNCEDAHGERHQQRQAIEPG